MTIVTYPTLSRSPNAVKWGKISNTWQLASPLSGAVQTIAMPGDRWVQSLTYTSLNDADRRKLRAFLDQMRGMAGRTLLPNFSERLPRGTITGVPLVNGAGQTGNALAIKSVAVGATILTGDMIGYGTNELRRVVADVTADGSGHATATLDAPIRYSPTDASAVAWNAPTALFMLAGNEQTSTSAPGDDHSFAMDFVEAFQ